MRRTRIGIGSSVSWRAAAEIKMDSLRRRMPKPPNPSHWQQRHMRLRQYVSRRERPVSTLIPYPSPVCRTGTALLLKLGRPNLFHDDRWSWETAADDEHAVSVRTAAI